MTYNGCILRERFGCRVLVSLCRVQQVIKTKYPNTITTISQKCVNIFAMLRYCMSHHENGFSLLTRRFITQTRR